MSNGDGSDDEVRSTLSDDWALEEARKELNKKRIIITTFLLFIAVSVTIIVLYVISPLSVSHVAIVISVIIFVIIVSSFVHRKLDRRLRVRRRACRERFAARAALPDGNSPHPAGSSALPSYDDVIEMKEVQSASKKPEVDKVGNGETKI